MIDSQADTGSSAGSRLQRRWIGLAAVFLVLLVLVGGAAVYWELNGRGNEDPGVTGCRSAGVLVRAEQGQVASADEVQRVGELFERSAHDDLKSAGVFAAGMVQRVQDPRNIGPGAELRRAELGRAIPRMIAACENHQVTVRA
ncbi:hypothetical protein [Micromonospora chokoriensis]|uniref:hypothetical protein n=1 Tax=Micromonospora chokoriensis TaxID=356851 RepID=UPI0004C3CECF|nr:hypothetical protein [Micromonospora chokoriensis]